jgi:CDGSH-type Zn-finger protein/truncated hemoglobin YjbI
MTAGPSFELFYENDYLMPHRGAAWALLEERLRETAEFCQRLRAKAGVTESLAAQLAPVGEALDEIANSLAAHFSDWGATSRYSQQAELSKEIPGAHLGSLLEHATELAAAFPAAWINDDPARRVADLFADAHHLFVTAAETAGIHGPDSPRLERVAARLVDSVLRPLSDTLARASAGEGPASQDQAPSREFVVDRDIDAQLSTLALAATRQRADLPTNSRLSAGLAEATACLQDLSIEFAPSEGPLSADVRLAQLRAIQHELGPTIQVTADGPYLATNATNVVSGLGVRLATTPQMALCRCGQSAIKPLCDGSHARVGFSGAKDPKRIVDQRDTYVGQQVTVLDNRGTCQHSGLCTDRLATVFHAGSEPFVTPSGGRMDEIIRAVRDCPSGALSYTIDAIEAREDVDRHGTREPAIEVSTNGPYRITGGIELIDAAADPEPLVVLGASAEHYALCRCGHSQNKPFCSGMHWYVEFHDPVPDPAQTPTMFEWCGGLPALERMTRLFYEKYVPQDPILAPLFATMSPDHPQRVAAWLGEVFGGPAGYSEAYGGNARMVSQHLGKSLTEASRVRWVSLLLQSAAEAGLPSDPEFAAAFQSYIDCGSRSAAGPRRARSPCCQRLPARRHATATDADAANGTGAVAPGHPTVESSRSFRL